MQKWGYGSVQTLPALDQQTSLEFHYFGQQCTYDLTLVQMEMDKQMLRSKALFINNNIYHRAIYTMAS